MWKGTAKTPGSSCTGCTGTGSFSGSVGIPAPGSHDPGGEPAAIKPARNWLAILSFIVSLGSWVVYPVILGFFAIILGISALFLARKKRAKVPVSAVLAIIIGLCAIILNLFWLDIFPPPEVLPPVR